MYAVSFEKWADITGRRCCFNEFPLLEILARCERVKGNFSFPESHRNVRTARSFGVFNEQTLAYDFAQPEMEVIPIQEVNLPIHRREIEARGMEPGRPFELIAFGESVTMPKGTIVVAVGGKQEEIMYKIHFYCITSTGDGWELGETYWYLRNEKIFDQVHVLGCKVLVAVS